MPDEPFVSMQCGGENSGKISWSYIEIRGWFYRPQGQISNLHINQQYRKNMMYIKVIYRTLALLAFFPLLFSACSDGSDRPLIGKWEHKEQDTGILVVLEFTPKKIIFSAAGFSPAETSYTYIDEDTIKVRNPESGADEEASYTIIGDKLAISFSGEDKVEYNRVK